MKPIFLLLAAALSCTVTARAASRPRFGGALRIETRASLSSLDTTSDANGLRSGLRDLILRNVCDRLVELNREGTPRASLAESWRSENGDRSWHFRLRAGVTLQNGVPLAPQIVGSALSQQNPTWHVHVAGSELAIESDTPIVDLPYALAEPRNSICIASDNGQWIGSGPFQLSAFQPDRYVELRVFEDAWRGRPFLDGVRIEMGKSLGDQATDLQLGRADVIEADPTHPAPAATITIVSRPMDLITLAFTPNHPAAGDANLREALARSIDRSSIYSVLLRRQGDAGSGFLPEWISGYAHVFSILPDLALARQLRNRSRNTSPLTLAYDGNDDLIRLIAERVALNARDAGIAIDPRPESPLFRSFNADVKLVRVRLESPDAAAALSGLADLFDVSSLSSAASAANLDALYSIENDALKNHSFIPIAQVLTGFSVKSSVHDAAVAPWAETDLGNWWIEDAR